MQKQRWAVVLAAGSGTRLQSMTESLNGESVPKQYCSLNGGPSLLRLSLARAQTVVPNDRILCVVAEEHEKWWVRELAGLPAENIIVQPGNRGTAVGTLLPTLSVLSRDPYARITFLPADHYVADEQVLTGRICDSFSLLEEGERRVVLLGLRPDEADSELGYIRSMPKGTSTARQVLRFVEKPSSRRAKALIRDGALWNSFVFSADAFSLMRLLRRRLPEQVRAFKGIAAETLHNPQRLADIYETLTTADLSGDVFAGSENELAVIDVPSCGWSDLGTPDRVGRCIEAGVIGATVSRSSLASRPTHVNLTSRWKAQSIAAAPAMGVCHA